ncbi:recombinase family protein [Streptomyces sp. NBC_01255]|uniref:recombinase family protein n=1 Tax=Streptomyces sp. NBC_01255 TaxID=2903798 RepID=UPI002E33ED46|nr:recombinase family protein [Streptomyces sp. NBC_01255]
MTKPLPDTFRGSPPDDEGEPWIGYIRVSTWKEEKISPELQKAALNAWAARTGRRIVDFITDLDMTGRNFKRKIMRGIERVEAGEARGIAVWKYSRFGRSRDGIAINLKRLTDAGGQLESATEEADARTATGRLQRGILFEFAAYESDVRGEQWRETHEHRITKLKLPATGRPRFGYVWHPRRVPDPKHPGLFILQDEKYVAHPETGPVMADRYRQYIDGAPFYALLDELNTNGHRTVRGGLWTAQTLIRYMDSGFCAGLLRVHNPECKCPPGKRGNCPNAIFVPGAQEELIDLDLWQQYQDRRQTMRKTPPRSRQPLHLLTALARCGGCRGTVPRQSRMRMVDGIMQSVRGHHFACGRRAVTGKHGCEGVWVLRTDVEDDVRDWVMDKAAPGIDAAPSVPTPRTPLFDQRATAARERARLEAEERKHQTALANLRADRAANPDEYGPGEYEAARDVIRKQQAATGAALDRVAKVELTPHQEDYEPIVATLADGWEVLDDGQRNSLLRQLARRVVLTRKPGGGATVTVHPVWEPDPWA